MLQPWALLQFAFLLTVAISCFAIIISELHIAEEQAWKETKERLASIR